MKKTAILLSAAILAFGCESGELNETGAVSELDGGMMDRIESLVEEWAAYESQGLSMEAAREERKLRKLADTNFAVLRAGMLSSSERKRAVSAAAIGFSLDTGVVRYLLEMLKDKNSVARANALLGLSRIAYKRMPVEPVCIMLNDEDENVRRMAVICLEKIAGVMNEKAVAKELGNAMIDPDSGVRMNAAKALGTLGNMEGLDVLLKRGLSDEDPRVRYNSAIALARLKSFDAVDGMIEAGLKENNEAVKREIDRALSETTGKRHDSDFKNWKAWWDDQKAKKKE